MILAFPVSPGDILHAWLWSREADKMAWLPVDVISYNKYSYSILVSLNGIQTKMSIGTIREYRAMKARTNIIEFVKDLIKNGEQPDSWVMELADVK